MGPAGRLISKGLAAGGISDRRNVNTASTIDVQHGAMRPSRRDLLVAVPLASAAVALAVGPAHAQEHGAEAETASEAEVARSVELGGMVFPVFDEKRKLRNYLFISARMLAGPGKDVWKYREQQHFIRDAIVRVSHRVSFHKKGDIRKLDEKLAATECLAAANSVVGEKDALVTMTFTQIASRK